MTIRVGVIGTGVIGTDHADKLQHRIAGTAVSVVTDIDHGRAARVAAGLGDRVRVAADAHELIASDDVDAVLITSIGETHAEFTLACIAAGKPVLCEKPLAPTTAECVQILDAEVALGRRLVIVGFMRRVDAGYRRVKASLDSGAIGEALILHNVHRDTGAPESFTSPMVMTDSLIHEIDVTRWLLGEEIVSVQVVPSRHTRHAFLHLQDPMFALFTTRSGILSTAEFLANGQYGYDVRCELVGADGTASVLNPVVADQVTAGLDVTTVPADWRERFSQAYADELQAWIRGLERGEIVGPSAWDGYAATRVTELGIASIASGRQETIDYIERPALYR
jgi:myo-inositol 2-dehydrogenase / D-chiro-inositol 1-dehydrogenase